jgi:hypothetical protein
MPATLPGRNDPIDTLIQPESRRRTQMTQHITHGNGYRDAEAEYSKDEIRSTVAALIGRLGNRSLPAAYCRGYVEYFVRQGRVTPYEADLVLARIAAPHWCCTWFPWP